MTRLVSVEQRKSEFIVTSYTQTLAGFWQMNGHFECIPSGVDTKRLGLTVLAALKASNQVSLPEAAGSAEPFAPVLVALGLKSYAQYMKGAISVSVEAEDDGTLRVTPARNGGAKEGFVEISEKMLVLSDPSAETLGNALEQAMAQAN